MRCTCESSKSGFICMFHLGFTTKPSIRVHLVNSFDYTFFDACIKNRTHKKHITSVNINSQQSKPMNLISFCLLFFLLPNSTQFVEIVVIPSTGINYNLLLLDLQTDSYGWREREKDRVVLPSGRLCCWTPAAASDSACHSSVAEAPTNMPQILPDNTTHNEREKMKL